MSLEFAGRAMTEQQQSGGPAGRESSFLRRLLSAGGWTLGGMIATQSLRLGSNLIMTRFLLPEAFGLMAMVTIVQMLVNMVSDIGIRQSIVRAEEGGDAHFLRVAWTVQIMRSAGIATVVACFAGLLALFGDWFGAETVYADPRLPDLIFISTLAILMRGAETVALHLASRNLRLSRLTLLEISEHLLAISFMLLFVQIETSVWALLLGMLVAAAARLCLSHLMFPRPRMRPAFDRSVAAELWTFGRWLIGASLAGFLARYSDRLVLGGVLDKTAFGYYAIASLWIQTGAVVLQRLNDRVIYPAISEVRRSDPARLSVILRRIQIVFDWLCLAAFLAAFLGGDLLIRLLYTPDYHATGLLLTLLSFRLLSERYLPVSALVLASGDSRTTMNVTVLRAVYMVTVPLLLFRLFGLEAAVLGVALTPLIGAHLLLQRAANHLKASPPFFGMIVPVLVVFAALAGYLFVDLFR